MSVVGPEVASKEFGEWMDAMDTPEKARQHESVAPHVERIVKAICAGELVINEDKSITHKLRFPLGDGTTKELKYSFRLSIGDYYEKLKGLSPLKDETEYTMKKIELMSKQAPEIIRRLERRDFNVASSLTVFF